jgi:ProP effector
MSLTPPPDEPPGATAAPPPRTPAARQSHAECTALLQQHFPALFGAASVVRPLKLHIQADIQARAPGVFTKAALSHFLRRYTASGAYLNALARSPQRYDLDGQPAGEVSAEHRQGARDELARRRQVQDAQRADEDEARRQRARLLRDYETTTLTRANFCALKGIDEGALDALLALAREDAARRPPPPPMRAEAPRDMRREPRPAQGPRGPRGDAGPPRRPPGGGAPRG